MTTLNEVLRTDPNHYLAMIRRSQVYKKVFFVRFRRESSTGPLRICRRLLLFVLITYRWQLWRSRSRRWRARTRTVIHHRSHKASRNLMRSFNSISVTWKLLIVRVAPLWSTLWVNGRVEWPSVETLLLSTRLKIMRIKVTIRPQSVKSNRRKFIWGHPRKYKWRTMCLLLHLR